MKAVSKQPFDREDMARRRRRSLVMALFLGFLVMLFFATTIAKMGALPPPVAGG
jgi:hypothetical protein